MSSVKSRVTPGVAHPGVQPLVRLLGPGQFRALGPALPVLAGQCGGIQLVAGDGDDDAQHHGGAQP